MSATAGSVTLRAAGLFGLWIMLAGAAPADLPVGLVAAAIATRVSLVLLPPAPRRVDPLVLVRLILRFPWQSVVAGVDVARRAFAPRLRLRPGLVDCDVALPPGRLRAAFAGLSSLLPGTVPVGEPDAPRLLVHGLDIGEPIERQMAEEAALFARALGRGSGHG